MFHFLVSAETRMEVEIQFWFGFSHKNLIRSVTIDNNFEVVWAMNKNKNDPFWENVKHEKIITNNILSFKKKREGVNDEYRTKDKNLLNDIDLSIVCSLCTVNMNDKFMFIE